MVHKSTRKLVPMSTQHAAAELDALAADLEALAAEREKAVDGFSARAASLQARIQAAADKLGVDLDAARAARGEAAPALIEIEAQAS
jgi:t-SNARE complex subunit (syntaxin)